MGDEDRDDDTQQHPTTYSSFPNFRPDAAIAPEVTVSAFDFSAPDANIGGGSALAPRQLPGNGGAPTSHSDPTLDEFRGSMKELARNAVERRELSVYKSTPRILIYGRSESYRAMAQLGDGDAAGGFQRPPPVVEFNYNYNAKTADAAAATWRRPGDGQVAGIRDRIVTTSTSDHTISSSNSVNVVPRSRQIGQDREVSTSYTDSLHEIFQQAAAHTNQQSRENVLCVCAACCTSLCAYV